MSPSSWYMNHAGPGEVYARLSYAALQAESSTRSCRTPGGFSNMRPEVRTAWSSPILRRLQSEHLPTCGSQVLGHLGLPFLVSCNCIQGALDQIDGKFSETKSCQCWLLALNLTCWMHLFAFAIFSHFFGLRRQHYVIWARCTTCCASMTRHICTFPKVYCFRSGLFWRLRSTSKQPPSWWVMWRKRTLFAWWGARKAHGSTTIWL